MHECAKLGTMNTLQRDLKTNQLAADLAGLKHPACPAPYRVRPIAWDDGPRLNELLHRLSDESRFMRFMINIKEHSPDQLARFTQIDTERDAAIAAVITEDGKEKIIGVARFMLLPKGNSAEFAIVVADEFQNMGIGWRLMNDLCDIAKNHHLDQIEGMILAQNPAMLKLMASLGFKIEHDPEDLTMRRAVKNLRQ
jgi:acetyltransferase